MQAEMSAEVREQVAKVWWVLLLRGIAMILLGVLALGSPGSTAIVYVNVMAIFIMVEGIFRIVAAFTGGDGQTPRWLYFLGGILEVIVAFWVLSAPLFSTVIAVGTVYYLLAFSGIIGGMIEIVVAIRDKAGIWPILGGIISIIFGVMLLGFANTEEVGGTLILLATMVQIFGIFAIVGGITNIVVSFQLRSLK